MRDLEIRRQLVFRVQFHVPSRTLPKYTTKDIVCRPVTLMTPQRGFILYNKSRILGLAMQIYKAICIFYLLELMFTVRHNKMFQMFQMFLAV